MDDLPVRRTAFCCSALSRVSDAIRMQVISEHTQISACQVGGRGVHIGRYVDCIFLLSRKFGRCGDTTDR